MNIENKQKTPSQSYAMSLAIWDHRVTFHPTQVNTPRLNHSQSPVLDLPTLEGWKAEWPRWPVTYWDGLSTHRPTHPSAYAAVHGRELNSQPVDQKSDALTTTPPNHVVVVVVVVVVVIVVVSAAAAA